MIQINRLIYYKKKINKYTDKGIKMISIGIELSVEEYLKTPLYIRILHNIRNLATKNSIFSTENNFNILNEEFKNEGILSIEDMKEYFIQEEEYLKKVVKQKLKQKSQNKLHIVESLISISDDDESENLTKEDIKEKIKVYTDYLKKKGIKIYNVSYHEDEGIYIDIETQEVIDHLEEGFKYDKNTMEIKKNKHIHIIHSNVSLDNGRSYTNEIYRDTEQYNKDNNIEKFIKTENGKMKENPKFLKGLSLLQDKISECFKMRRGIINSKNKHKDIKTYKTDKKNESKLIKQIKQYYEKIIVEKNEIIEDLRIDKNQLENIIENNFEEIYKLQVSNSKKSTKIEELKNENETLLIQLNKYEIIKTSITSKDLDNETKKRLHKINIFIKKLISKLDIENKLKLPNGNKNISIQKNGVEFIIKLSSQLDFILTQDLQIKENMDKLKSMEKEIENYLSM
jgi:hypothetical protein